MRVKKLGNSWWIVSEKYGHMGPYKKKIDAESDMGGVKRLEKWESEDGFVTSFNAPIMVEK